jgi:hypothetical protein
MDALWTVADQILTPAEIAALSPGEVFLLTCGFYLHDVGMAYAATNEGLRLLKESTPYKSFMAVLPQAQQADPTFQAQAVAVAVRQLHASAGKELATNEIPGTQGRYLFEALSIRELWGATCGDIAASHHWSLARLEASFGPLGVAPLPGGRRADLLYVAACLRLIDYAHINRERASSLDRAFRGQFNVDSVVHWLAQEHVDGPVRDQDELIYRASNPISNVDAWWLYYEMLSGLDSEIRAVRRMLDQRRSEQKKLSLSGVRGAASPELTARLIPTSGFLPIEVNLRTGSINRLVELLAGETLYGPNPMAAVRELVQNARDAVLLKAEVAETDSERALLNLPITVSLISTTNPPTLEVVDHGIGMTQRVMTDYLIAIASDYWATQFATDFPTVAERGFKNAGKFGIGFLSVFMLGEEVDVESNRAGGDRYRLSLRGVGRRGELREVPSAGGSGTAIRIKLREGAVEKITPLDELLPVYAPTLPHSLVVSIDGKQTAFPRGWLSKLPLQEFGGWVDKAIETLGGRALATRNFSFVYLTLDGNLRRSRARDDTKWPDSAPEYVDGNTRLVGSFFGTSVLCLRGLAVQSISTPGFFGVVELDTVGLEVSRNRTVSADISSIMEAARKSVTPMVTKNLDKLSSGGLIVNKTPFIANCVSLYGKDSLLNSRLPWISQLMFPGNVEMLESTTLITRLAATRSLFLSYNSGPWTAMKDWESASPRANELGLLLDGDGQRTPGYISTDERQVGALQVLYPDWERSVLFKLLIELIAQSWQKSPADLVHQDGWTRFSNHVSGRVTRT